jgi:nucleoside phosphorylase
VKQVPAAELKGKLDFGIITIREDESQAVLKRLPTKTLCKGKQTYSISTLLTSNGDEYVIASVRCLEQGNQQAQSVAQRLIDDLDPQWILLVGIAGCIPDPDYTLGDVILASRLHDFCVSARFENGASQFNVRGGPMHPDVQNLLASLPFIESLLGKWNTSRRIGADRPKTKLQAENFYGDDVWKDKTRASLKRYFGPKSNRKIPKVLTGSVASSDTLVKDTNLVKEWQQSARQVAGIEMELAGVYQAAHDAQKPVLAIRGISDVVGFKRSPEWTEYACHTAAAVAVALLKFRPINPIGTGVGLTRTDDKVSTPVTVSPAFLQVPHDVPPLAKSETLYTNLLPVTFFPDKIYVVNTEAASRSDVWNLLRDEVERPPDDWVYHGKTLYAFHDFSDPMWKKVVDANEAEPHDTPNWSETTDIAATNIFIELLKGCLRQMGRSLDLSYRHKKPLRFLYYSPTEDLSPRTVVTMSLQKKGTHTVFSPYTSKKTGEVMYYRHHAFRFEFEKIESKWYLQITPTYHYTWNGYRVYWYYEDLISGIKRLENNEAVFRQVLFWAEVLKGGAPKLLEDPSAEYYHLRFGELLKFTFPFGVVDEAWAKKETAGNRADSQGQGGLLFER